MLDLRFYSYNLPSAMQKPFSGLVTSIFRYGHFTGLALGTTLAVLSVLPSLLISLFNEKIGLKFGLACLMFQLVFFYLISLYSGFNTGFLDKLKFLIASINHYCLKQKEPIYCNQTRFSIITRRLIKKLLPHPKLYSLNITEVKEFKKLPINLQRNLKLFCMTGFQNAFLSHLVGGTVVGSMFFNLFFVLGDLLKHDLKFMILKSAMVIVVLFQFIYLFLVHKKAEKDFYSNAHELISLINLHTKNLA